VKLGVYRAYFFKDLDGDVQAATDAALEKLKRAGATELAASLTSEIRHRRPRPA